MSHWMKDKLKTVLVKELTATHNSFINRTTEKSPFEALYGRPIPHFLDRVPIPYLGRVSADAETYLKQVLDVQQ